MEKQGTAGEAKEDNVIRRIRIACWVNKATDTRSENNFFLLFHVKNGSAKRLKSYATRSLFVLSYFLNFPVT